MDAVTADASRFSIQTTTTWEIPAVGVNDGPGPGVNVGDRTASEPAAGVDDGPAAGLALTGTAEEAGLPGGVVP